MGGAVRVAGNITPHAEFNIYNDPKAAGIVFSSGAALRLVGLDVTHQTYVSREQLPWVGSGYTSSRIAAKILFNWFKTHINENRYYLHDPLAIAAAIQSDILTYRRAEIGVDTSSLYLRGKTNAIYDTGPVQFATGGNFLSSTELILETLQATPQTPTNNATV